MSTRPRSSSGLTRVDRDLIRCVYENPDITRQELASRLGQSPASLSLVIRRLIGNGWLEESGRAASLGGRRPVQLRLCAQDGLVLSQVVTPEVIRSVLVKPSGEVVADSTTESGPDPRAHAASGAVELMRQVGVEETRLIGVGVALSELCQSGARTGGEQTNDIAPDRTYVEDSLCRATLLWEVYDNPMLRQQTVLLVGIGNEVGAALSMKGSLYRGAGGAAMNASQIPVSSTGRGGAKTTAFGEFVVLSSVLARVRERLEAGERSLIRDLADGNLDNLKGQHVGRAAQAADSLAFRIASDVSEAAGDAVALLATLLRPDTVLLCGPVVGSGIVDLDTVRRSVRLHSDPEIAETVRIVVSDSEELSAAHGVAHLVLRRWLEDIGSTANGA